MKTFKEYCVMEHPTLASKILKKINPLDKLKDKMDNLRPGKILDKMKKKLDKLNPLSVINKANTERIKKKIDGLRDKKKGISQKIDTLKSRIGK
jgi:predicted  nucleic acid-binding Zn-ribbon protein